MFIIRWILAKIILTANFIFAPKKRQRPIAEQNRIDEQTANMSLYQYEACPFCVKVRREMRRQNLNISTVNAKTNENKQLLANEGGKIQVPCLRIEREGKTQWLYESKEIIQFFNQQFA